MIGQDLYKIETCCELSNERLKSLIFFYAPLIGNDALALYEYLVLSGPTSGFKSLNELLDELNISIDYFEEQCRKLNEYRLLKTLNKANQYIFIFNNPLTRREFINDGIMTRYFIMKTSGKHYQKIISDVYQEGNYDDYEDTSQALSLDAIKNWNKDNETYLKGTKATDFNFGTLFDVNVFLQDMSTNLLPMRFRTNENMKALATLADLYNISYDKMRTFIPRVALIDSNEFDLKQLKYLCMNARGEYRLNESGSYNIPCLNFLMNLQGGKEVTESDKKIIFNLSNKYHLNPSVINVLLEHSLKMCNNRLIEKYIYAVASDLNRNNIKDAKGALEMLQMPYNKGGKKDELPTYSTDNNASLSKLEQDELKKLMGKK